MGEESTRGGEKHKLRISKCVGDKGKQLGARITKQETKSSKAAVNL